MTRMTGFSSPFLLGFEELERLIDRATKSAADGYPPYNIEKIPQTGDAGGEIIRITLAVAGFSREELEVTLEDNQLVIRSRAREEASRAFLHRGIAARQFQKSFVLADGMEVLAARLENGLLGIDIQRREPERLIRKIEISGG